jgi:hypothetical protein
MVNNGYLDDLKKSPYSMEWWDSKWELDYMNELESDKDDGTDTVKWTKNHGLQIKYFNSDNKFKTYKPDFLIEKSDGSIELVEMKGTHLLKNPDTKKKIEFAKKWCEARKIKYRIISKYQ